LRQNRDTLFAERPDRALSIVSLQFAGQETVPHDRFKTETPEAVIAVVEALSRLEDHFSLIAGFEICAHNAGRDLHVVDMGTRLLDRLFGDKDRMLGRCTLFGAMFVLATARLSLLPRFRQVPTYWKRMVAAAHASLVARTMGNRPVPEEIFSWAMRQHQDHFQLSVYAEMSESPRWRPEWIAPPLLAADCYGRALQVLSALGETSLPEDWKRILEAAGDWMSEMEVEVGAYLPSLTQGERPTHNFPLTPQWQTRRDELLDALKANPGRESLIRMGNIAEIAGVPSDAGEAVYHATQRALAESGTDVDLYGPVTVVAARLAALSRDEALAQLVADHLFYIEQARPQDIVVKNTLFRLLECAAAVGDTASARGTLVKRLEHLSVQVPSDYRANRLSRALLALRRVHEPLNEPLARAESLARLAAPHAKVVTESSPMEGGGDT
jgi:hypothetical protein